jgi:hypothetical protein
VIAINFAGTAFTGCGLNPSEIFGIALITNQSANWSIVWIYIVGPITGALIIGNVTKLQMHCLSSMINFVDLIPSFLYYNTGILYTLLFLHRPDEK